jgi:hypothetical protein
MPTTFGGARRELLRTFYAAWQSGSAAIAGSQPAVFFDGVGDDTEPPPDETWARVAVRHVTGIINGVGNTVPRRRTEKTGFIRVQIYTPLSLGDLQVAEQLAELVKEAFEAQTTLPGDIVFFNTRIEEDGPYRAWYQMSVTSDWRYAEYV